jgi:alkylation response protein AidB-like acyl-CoA dehydrogenase
MARSGGLVVLVFLFFILGDEHCKVCIFMGKTDPKNKNIYKQQSMIVVPMDAKGFSFLILGISILRSLNVFGYNDAPHGHCEVHFNNVRVPLGNILLGEGNPN